MLTSIMIGLVALVTVSVSSAVFLYGHLTGRVKRSTALGVALLAMAAGAGLAIGGTMEVFTYNHTATLLGGFLMLASAINALLVHQVSHAARRG